MSPATAGRHLSRAMHTTRVAIANRTTDAELETDAAAADLLDGALARALHTHSATGHDLDPAEFLALVIGAATGALAATVRAARTASHTTTHPQEPTT